MSKVVLHIGTHKTGTTSLQEFLFENAEAIARQGMTYFIPKETYPGIAKERNGHFLYRYVKSVTDPEESVSELEPLTAANIAAFRKHAGSDETLLLSDERLWYQGAIRPRSWQLISGLFDESGVTDVQVIVYFRRQDQFIASLWNQWVKGRTRMRSTLESFAKRSSSRAIMDYRAGLQAIEEVFGRDCVAIRIYERNQLADRDVRRDFCELVGIDAADLFFPESESNPGLNANVAEIKRQANYLAEYRATDNFLSGPAIAASQASEVAGASALTPELSEKILARYDEGNAFIARERLGRDDGVMFASREAPAVVSSPADLVNDEIRFFVAALAQEHDRLLAAERRIARLEARMSRKRFLSRLVAQLRRER